MLISPVIVEDVGFLIHFRWKCNLGNFSVESNLVISIKIINALFFWPSNFTFYLQLFHYLEEEINAHDHPLWPCLSSQKIGNSINAMGEKTGQIIFHPYKGVLRNPENRKWDFLCVLIWTSHQNKVLSEHQKCVKRGRQINIYIYIFGQICIKYIWKETQEIYIIQDNEWNWM